MNEQWKVWEREEARRRTGAGAALARTTAHPALLACGGGGLSSPPQHPQALGKGFLTVPGLALLPSVFCRWQLKISSARCRYLVIFSFTASHRSLLGSTVRGKGSPGLTPDPPTALQGWCSNSHCPSSVFHSVETEYLFLRPADSGPTSVLEPFLQVGDQQGKRKEDGRSGWEP